MSWGSRNYDDYKLATPPEYEEMRPAAGKPRCARCGCVPAADSTCPLCVALARLDGAR